MIYDNNENGYVPVNVGTFDNESISKISNSMKEFRKETKMKHVDRHSETEPEKLFKELISKFNIPYDIYQWYKPKDYIENFERNYEIDFAIPELKLAFEVNGNFHYDTSTWELKEYYKERREYIESFGWKQIDIHYLICFDTEKLTNIIENALNGKFTCESDVINEIKDYYAEKMEIKKKKYLDKLKERKTKIKDLTIDELKKLNVDKSVHESLKKEKLIQLKEYLNSNPNYVCAPSELDNYIESLMNSKMRIEFVDELIEKIEIIKKHKRIKYDKLGWASKLMKFFKLTNSGTSRYVRTYLPKFYEDRCFRRKDMSVPRSDVYSRRHEKLREERKQKILNSNIDYTKRGWIKELASYLGITRKGTMSTWLKNYMPEFYEKYKDFN